MRAFLFIGVCLLLVSCFDTGDCLFTNTNVVKVNFMNISKPLEAQPVALDSLFVPDDRGYFPVAGDTITSIQLVVNPTINATRYVFQYGERSDTLVLSYANQTIVLSPDCGSYNFQSDLQVAYSTFGEGRVVIKNRQLLTNVTSNVEIFF